MTGEELTGMTVPVRPGLLAAIQGCSELVEAVATGTLSPPPGESDRSRSMLLAVVDAGTTNSPLESNAGMESEVPDPGP